MADADQTCPMNEEPAVVPGGGELAAAAEPVVVPRYVGELKHMVDSRAAEAAEQASADAEVPDSDAETGATPDKLIVSIHGGHPTFPCVVDYTGIRAAPTTEVMTFSANTMARMLNIDRLAGLEELTEIVGIEIPVSLAGYLSTEVHTANPLTVHINGTSQEYTAAELGDLSETIDLTRTDRFFVMLPPDFVSETVLVRFKLKGGGIVVRTMWTQSRHLAFVGAAQAIELDFGRPNLAHSDRAMVVVDGVGVLEVGGSGKVMLAVESSGPRMAWLPQPIHGAQLCNHMIEVCGPGVANLRRAVAHTYTAIN